jgi:hypothetical protein
LGPCNDGDVADQTEKQTTAKMIAELLREAGLLFFVFGLLDAQLKDAPAGVYPIDVALAFACMAGGVLLERLR